MNRDRLDKMQPPGKSDDARHPTDAGTDAESREALLDEALDETFPASDPVSIIRSPTA